MLRTILRHGCHISSHVFLEARRRFVHQLYKEVKAKRNLVCIICHPEKQSVQLVFWAFVPSLCHWVGLVFEESNNWLHPRRSIFHLHYLFSFSNRGSNKVFYWDNCEQLGILATWQLRKSIDVSISERRICASPNFSKASNNSMISFR